MRVLYSLNEQGVEARLQVIGCVPPDPVLEDDRVHVTPFLNKQDPMQLKVFEQQLGRSHFLILPSIAECFGIAHAEASAFGVPSIALDVGGVSEVVVNKDTGLLFDKHALPASIAGTTKKVLDDESTYLKMCYSAAAHVRTDLTWNRAGHRIIELLQEIA